MTCGRPMSAQVDVLGVWTRERLPEGRALNHRNELVRAHVVVCQEASMELWKSPVRYDGG